MYVVSQSTRPMADGARCTLDFRFPDKVLIDRLMTSGDERCFLLESLRVRRGPNPIEALVEPVPAFGLSAKAPGSMPPTTQLIVQLLCCTPKLRDLWRRLGGWVFWRYQAWRWRFWVAFFRDVRWLWQNRHRTDYKLAVSAFVFQALAEVKQGVVPAEDA